MNNCAELIPFSQERLIAFLEGEMGLDLSAVHLDQTLDIVMKSGAVFASFEDYAAAVASMISVHETYFLRHHGHHEWLENTWLPEMLDQKPSEPVRILSAGCSTGEEPYSLYAHLAPIAEAAGATLQIVALDISKKSLDIARVGKYGLWSLRGVSIDREHSWLDVRARSVYVKEHIKNRIHFERHNLCRPLPYRNYFDLVLCRNVLIYMHQQAVHTIYENLACALKPGACLIPGPSDPNPALHGELSLAWQDGIRTYRKALVDSASLVSEVTPVKHPETPGKPEAMIVPVNRAAVSTANHNHAMIETLIRSGHYDLAKCTLESNLLQDKFDVRSYIMLAVLALDMEDIDIAREAARKASFLKADSPYTVYTMSDVKNRMGDKAAAKNDLLWVKNLLERVEGDTPVKYCEEITSGQLKEVVESRLSAMNEIQSHHE